MRGFVSQPSLGVAMSLQGLLYSASSGKSKERAGGQSASLDTAAKAGRAQVAKWAMLDERRWQEWHSRKRQGNLESRKVEREEEEQRMEL